MSRYVALKSPFCSKDLPVQSNNRNTTKRCEICSKLTKKTPEQRQKGQIHLKTMQQMDNIFQM